MTTTPGPSAAVLEKAERYANKVYPGGKTCMDTGYALVHGGFLKGHAAATREMEEKLKKVEEEKASNDADYLVLSAQVNELVEAMETAHRHCVCHRNMKGFDYGEEHPRLGKPQTGSRWLTPRDILMLTLDKHRGPS